MAQADAQAGGLGTDGAPVVSVAATDTTCTPDKATISATKTWFKITNNGTKITELYLEKADSTELIQVEKIRPGETGAFSTALTAGSFLVACESGMAGHDTQVRTPITVK
jgi:iron uptake system component EfeO